MKTIILDPGHGAHDPGAVGPNKTRESERALDVCKIIESILWDYADLEVILTREDDDTFLELHERAKFANDHNADLFVSYHFNSASSQSTAMSFEVFTTPGQNNSDRLAQCIIDRQLKLCPWQSLRADRSDGDDDKEANFAVIRLTKCPAVLVEGEFIHTRDGERSILNTEHQKLRARAVAYGILDFLGIEVQEEQEPAQPEDGPSIRYRLGLIREQLDAIEREVGRIDTAHRA